MPFERVDTAEKPFLVAEIVPRRIEPLYLETIVKQRDGGECFRCLVIDHADVDALVQADLETARANFIDTRLPLLARLAEKIVVEQMQMTRPWLAAPDIGDRIDGARLALFRGHNAEAAFQPATALREADGTVESIVNRIVQLFVLAA